MEAEEIIALFDSIWFSSLKTESNPQTSSASESNPQIKIHQNKARSHLSAPMMNTHSFSPDSVLFSSHLQKNTLSEREITEAEHEEVKKPRINKSKKIGTSKSLSELEFEEVKGFMDLGFVFSEEDRNSRLVEIIPGLQRMEKKEEDDEEEEESDESVQRPYLSEAWEDLERRKSENVLLQWRMPGFTNEIGMKSNLKKWAHAVAATIK